MDTPNRRKLISLVSKLQDQTLSESEVQELQALLQSDSKTRKLYYELMDMEQSLADDASILQPETHPESSPKSNLLPFFTMGKVAALILLGSVLSYGTFKSIDHFSTTSLSSNWTANTSVGIISDLEGTLTRSDGVRITSKTELTEGDYELKKGSARFDFFAGVSVEMEAPGTFSVVSPVHMNVLNGELAVEVYDARSMFKITSSKSAYVDLGTEFSIKVDDDGSSELHVYEGSVLASSLSKKGNSERIQLVTTDQTLRISDDSTLMGADNHELETERVPRIREPRRPALIVSPAYAASVQRSNPQGYWSFEDENEAVIESFAEKLPMLKIGNEVERVNDANNTYIQFNESSSFQALTFENPIHFESNQKFSVEFWIRPDRINRATVFAVYDPQSVKANGETDHLALIDLMHTPISFHHIPAAIRTAIRPVPSDDYYAGINMFTDQHYIPGQWMHIAFVKSDDYAATYINGEETNRVFFSETEHTLAGDYAVVFGQMSMQNWETALEGQKRPFVGALDEIAFYLHDLTELEIRRHYNASR